MLRRIGVKLSFERMIDSSMMGWTHFILLITTGLGDVSWADQTGKLGDGACDGFPCRNGGVCSDVDTSDGAQRYQCRCNPRWVGVRCEEFSDCDGNPCVHGGKCIESGDGFVCKCPIKYRGVYCEGEASKVIARVAATLRRVSHDRSSTLQKAEMSTLVAVIMCGVIGSGLATGLYLTVVCGNRMLGNNASEHTEFDKATNSLKDSAHSLVRHLTGQRDEMPYTTLAGRRHDETSSQPRSILKNKRLRSDNNHSTVVDVSKSADYIDAYLVAP